MRRFGTRSPPGRPEAVRIDAGPAHDSRDVAVAIAAVAATSDFVICGDYSLDRGTGSVPAFLAHELGNAQALGLVEVDTAAVDGGRLRVLRRLDGGRREVLDVDTPAVLSVEGSVRRLRRAPLAAAIRSKSADIEVVATAVGDHVPPAIVMPFRPRARTLAVPAGPVLSRVREILDIGGSDTPVAETVELTPAEAAARIVDQLRRWGYLGDDDSDDDSDDHANGDSDEQATGHHATG